MFIRRTSAPLGTSGVSVYTSTSGVLASRHSCGFRKRALLDRRRPAGKFAYVTNYNSNTISAYSIRASGVLATLDMDPVTGGIQNTIATGTRPRSIAIHPSGKFAYVANYSSNSISAYSIDASGVLASIDADGATAGNQTSIATRLAPNRSRSILTGGYAYVANAGDNSVSAYSIDPTTGALTAITADGSTGTSTHT